MRSTILSALSLLFFSTSVLATISSPAAGDQWPVEQDQMIMWDTTGLMEPIDIHLVPAGAKDTTVIITEIALQVRNTGKLQWAPPKTVDITEVVIIIVDAKKVTIISEIFIIIILDTTKMTSTKKMTTIPKMLPTTTAKGVALTAQSILANKTTILTTKSAMTSVVKATTLTTPVIILTTTPTTSISKSATIIAFTSKITTTPLAATSIKSLTTSAQALVTPAKPLTTPVILITASTKPTSKAANITVNTPAIQANVTAGGAAKATFTGAASHMIDGRGCYTLVGGLWSLLGMLLL